MVSLVICPEGRERQTVVGDRTRPNRLQYTALQSRRLPSSVLNTDNKPAVAFPTAAMMAEQTNKLRAKPEMTIAKLEILTANPETTDANLEKNFTATEMTMTARGDDFGHTHNGRDGARGRRHAGAPHQHRYSRRTRVYATAPQQGESGCHKASHTAYGSLCGGRLGAQTVKLL